VLVFWDTFCWCIEIVCGFLAEAGGSSDFVIVTGFWGTAGLVLIAMSTEGKVITCKGNASLTI
jgi:hypothetical protein